MTTPHVIDGIFQRDTRGNLVLATGLQYAQQRVLEFLRFQSGEWFLNKSLGVPYTQTPLTYTSVNILAEGVANISIPKGTQITVTVDQKIHTFTSTHDAALTTITNITLSNSQASGLATINFETPDKVDIPANSIWNIDSIANITKMIKSKKWQHHITKWTEFTRIFFQSITPSQYPSRFDHSRSH